MIVGFPLSAGSTSCEQDGALLPTEGAREVSMYDGENHGDSSWEMLILPSCGADVGRK
jgi:hypothetical protein